MRTTLLAVLLFSCTTDHIEPCPRMPLIISDSLPVQFWVNGEETFNEKEVCGLVKQDCFCQVLNCDDEITVQITDDTGKGYELVIYDTDNVEISRNEFVESSTGVYGVGPFTLDDSPCDRKVKFVIEQVESLGQFWQGNPQGSPSLATFKSVTYAEDRFVAVSASGSIWYSDNGIDWNVAILPVSLQQWQSVSYGNGVFVAVGSDTGTNQVASSTDGITWVARNAAAARSWISVAYGSGLFAAVSQSGTGDRVMTSPDGITWTSRVSAADLAWTSITYGNDRFVAVAASGTGNRAMYSINGTSWTSGTTSADKTWRGVAYGNNVFVAVADNDGVMYSTTGATWTNGTSISGSSYYSIGFGNGVFVAGGTNQIATSLNGITWVARSSPLNSDWYGIAYGDGFFVGVGYDVGLNHSLMYSISTKTEIASSDCIDIRENHECTVLVKYENTSNFDGINYEAGSPGPTFQIRVPAIFFEEENPQEQEDLELSNGVIVTLRQSIVQKRKLELGYMPNYMHLKLQKIFMHDQVYIDGSYWRKRDAYDTNPVKKYNLKTASVLLTKYDSVEKNTI